MRNSASHCLAVDSFSPTSYVSPSDGEEEVGFGSVGLDIREVRSFGGVGGVDVEVDCLFGRRNLGIQDLESLESSMLAGHKAERKAIECYRVIELDMETMLEREREREEKVVAATSIRTFALKKLH